MAALIAVSFTTSRFDPVCLGIVSDIAAYREQRLDVGNLIKPFQEYRGITDFTAGNLKRRDFPGLGIDARAMTN